MLWGLLSLAYPAYPGYLLQTLAGERIVKPLVIRSIVSGIIAGIGFTFMSESQFRYEAVAFETLIHSNVGIVLSALDIVHYRDGAVFEFPGITIEMQKGSLHLYTAVYFSIIAASISLFFRTRNPFVYISFTAFFSVVGYLFSIAISVSTLVAIQSPDNSGENVLGNTRDTYWVIGAILIYMIFYFIAWRNSKKVHGTQDRLKAAKQDAAKP